MSSEIYVQIFLAELNRERFRLVVGVAADDDALAVWPQENNGLQTVFYRIESEEGAAWLNKMGEMLVGIVFGSISVGTVNRAHLHKGVLLPAPGAATLIAKYEIPVVILGDAIAKVVGEQEEGVLGGIPVHGAVTTLAL